MASMKTAGSGIEPPKKKRSLPFRRTVTRKSPVRDTSDGDDENDLDFFRQSKKVFPRVIKEMEEEAQRPATPDGHGRKRRKTSLDGERSGSRSLPISTMKSESLPMKTQLVPSDSSDDDLVMDVKGKGKEILRTAKVTTMNKRPFPAPSCSSTASSNDDDDFFPQPPSARKPNPLALDRRHTRQSRLQRDISPSRLLSSDDSDVVETKPNIIDDDGDDLEELDEKPSNIIPDELNEWLVKARESECQNLDAVVKVLITSRMPDTKPVMFKRKMGQNMKLVLDTWVAQQRNQEGIELPDGIEDTLFLTWKGNKVYSHSTVASLGVQLDGQGRIKGNIGEGYNRGSLHLEVWTEEAFTKYLHDKELQRARALGLLDEEDDRLADELEPTPAPEKKKKGIKIVLKAKNLEPLTTTGKAEHPISLLIDEFCKHRGIADQSRVSIYLDGEELDNYSLLGNADIDPDEINQLEVHIR